MPAAAASFVHRMEELLNGERSPTYMEDMTWVLISLTMPRTDQSNVSLMPSLQLHLLGPNPALPPLARFLRFPNLRETPVGPSHALLQCSFDDEALLLDALLALCLNRWIDWQGL